MAERARTNGHTADGEPQPKRRGRKPKDKAPAAGHNSGEIPTEVYERHLAAIQTKRTAMDKAHEAYKQARGEFRSAFKTAKADGCNIDAMKEAHRLSKLDQLEVVQDFRDLGRILRIMEAPIGTQFGLFPEVELPKPVNAVLAGQHAGKNGEPRVNNPHPPGTPEYEQWDGGWLEKQAAIAEEMRA